MSNVSPNHEPVEAKPPTLGDVLSLEATIEQVLKQPSPMPELPGLREISPTERIALTHYPEGQDGEHGHVISHISLTQKKPDGSYDTAMNYMVIRDGDETTTRLIKRPPFQIPSWEETFQGNDPHSVEGAEAHSAAVARVTGDLALYKTAGQMGMYELTAEEVRDLTQTISRVYPDEA